MRFLVTGGCGFIGSNLAAAVLKRGYQLFVFDNLYRYGSAENLKWLETLGKFEFVHGDIRSQNDVKNVVKTYRPNVIFHLAGQVAMTTSLTNPRLDFETNALGTFNLLEAIREYSPESVVVYSSTNKVYGSLDYLTYIELDKRYICKEYPNGFDENLKLSFETPYGCSKGAAEQYLLDYYRIYGIRTVVFRHSSMYGERQFPTYDQGWIGWFCRSALKIKSGEIDYVEISGNGKQVRDVLHVDDVIELYFSVVEKIENTAGKVYNIGGGMENSLSLLELFDILEEMLNIKIVLRSNEWRKSDQKVFVANIEKISRDTGWKPKVDKFQGIQRMLNWLRRWDL